MHTQTTCLAPPPFMEHRWGARVELDRPACLMLPDGSEVEARVCNASISGALIATDRKLPLYTALTVALTGDRARRRVLTLPACVTRVTRSHVAVEWGDLAMPTLVALLREAASNAATLRTHEPAFG